MQQSPSFPTFEIGKVPCYFFEDEYPINFLSVQIYYARGTVSWSLWSEKYKVGLKIQYYLIESETRIIFKISVKIKSSEEENVKVFKKSKGFKTEYSRFKIRKIVKTMEEKTKEKIEKMEEKRILNNKLSLDSLK